MASAVEIHGLVVSYQAHGGSHKVLDIPKLIIEEGESVLFVGPSGCGKTTLLSVIAGLRRPDAGSVMVRGTDLSLLSGHRLDLFRAATFGIVFQAFNLIEASPVHRNIALPLLLTGRGGPAATAWVETLLDKVKLTHRRNFLPPSLSIGERQRVAVARAIAGGAPLLIADEPTSNLDSENTEVILEIFREHLKKGTLIMASHENEMRSFAGKVIELKELMR